MNITEQIEVMKHYANGGIIEIYTHRDEDWCEMVIEPSWNWEKYKYRIKPKPVELLWEWWYDNVRAIDMSMRLRTETEAKEYFGKIPYGKTGRFFNPETKEFGVK